MNDPENETIDATARDVSEERAASGEVLPTPTASAGAFLDMVEDGQFGRELHEQLKDLGRDMRMVAERVGKAKGKLKVTFELECQDGQFKIGAKYDVTRPELPRPRSVMWQDHDDNFTRFPPNQHQMFGTRPVRAVGR